MDIRTSDKGLHLSCRGTYAGFFRPICIPWEDLRVVRSKNLLGLQEWGITTYEVGDTNVKLKLVGLYSKDITGELSGGDQ